MGRSGGGPGRWRSIRIAAIILRVCDVSIIRGMKKYRFGKGFLSDLVFSMVTICIHHLIKQNAEISSLSGENRLLLMGTLCAQHCEQCAFAMVIFRDPW